MSAERVAKVGVRVGGHRIGTMEWETLLSKMSESFRSPLDS